MGKTPVLLVHETLIDENGDPVTTIAFGDNAKHLLTRGWLPVDLDDPIVSVPDPEPAARNDDPEEVD